MGCDGRGISDADGFEQGQCLRVQRRSSREYAGRVERQFAPVDVAENSARLPHDYRERSDVEDVDVRFHDQIDATARQQVVMQKIAIAADAAAAADQLAKDIPARIARQRLDVADRDCAAGRSMRPGDRSGQRR